MMTELDVWTQVDGYAVAKGRDNDRCAWTSLHIKSGPMGQHSVHHRKLRGQGGTHAPSNLVTTTGSGTTGIHGLIHADPALATVLGYIVPSWGDPAATPIFRAAPFGAGYGWYLQDDDGQLEPCPPPTSEFDPDELASAMVAFDLIYIEHRRAADPNAL